MPTAYRSNPIQPIQSIQSNPANHHARVKEVGCFEREVEILNDIHERDAAMFVEDMRKCSTWISVKKAMTCTKGSSNKRDMW